MEETYYVIYNCYGLSLESGTEIEMKKKSEEIIESSKGEDGGNGCKLQFYFMCKKQQFINLISSKLP